MGLFLTLFILLLLAIIVVGYLWPDKVHIERSTVIDAPPERIFPLISKFDLWERWSPWAKLDPDAKYELTGDGVGARMKWTSEKREVGDGAQEIVELNPPRKMVTKLDFGEMGQAHATFDLEPQGQSTKVTWSLDTNMREGVPVLRQPMATYMGFFMEKFMDKPYTEGLASLKREAEAGA